MTIKNVKFSYIDRKYKLGPYVEFVAKLKVPSYDYDCIVNVIQEAHPECEQIRLLSYSRK